MYTFDQTMDFTKEYCRIRPVLPDHCVFLSLDTTGFQADSSSVSVIGILHEENDHLTIRQWLNETGMDQNIILHEFCEYLTDHGLTHIITYYGNHFALPFLSKKSEEFSALLSMMVSVDLHDIVKPLKNSLELTSCRQKALEAYFHLKRESMLSGKGLVKAYQQLVGLSRPGLSEHFSEDCKTQRQELQRNVLFHNEESLSILIGLSPILVLDELRQGHLSGCQMAEPGIFTFTVNGSFPEYLHMEKDNITLQLHGSQCVLRLPLWASEDDSSYSLKHYLPDSQNYYYLIMEDRAVHKSLASFVPKEYKKKATADTCYEWLSISHPVLESEEGCARFAHDTILYIISK